LPTVCNRLNDLAEVRTTVRQYDSAIDTTVT
jgi:hypothetical protein